jgi:hypothetical protein
METTPGSGMKASVLKSPQVRSLSPSAAKLRLLKKLRCTLRYEKQAWESGARLVAGVDEVGRGSLFGCVVAGAVILDPAYRIRGLRDSKLLLPERREVLAQRIREYWMGSRRGRCCAHRSNQHLSRIARGHARCRDAPCSCRRSSAD